MGKHPSQRGYFADELYKQMKKNPDIFLLVGDLGYKIFDKHFEDFPQRCINCGASEAGMVGIGVGLALRGKIPFIYTITSFYLRAAETISLYLSGEQIPVHLVGSGRDQDYLHDGPSHDASAAQNVIKNLDIYSYYPEKKEEIPDLVKKMISMKSPDFISLTR